ncbi:hypothetical protein Acife_0397 [Acidithiobacillus ferrivorans SS3]|jgi:hypothetical protein|uniref:Uncharacterized protein n=1 Tax=Acidithiobacillus ferrivorans SS3 TaxID=743299 RepID=G0JSR3_9PROT|nr:hypothetical protein Acife_0397 [Acidithiobacillus ferrivorans SS3]
MGKKVQSYTVEFRPLRPFGYLIASVSIHRAALRGATFDINRGIRVPYLA